MWVTDARPAPVKRARRSTQTGVAAVEFALVAILFFLLVFGILELARIIYMFNTLADVTRTAARAAAKIDFPDANSLIAARKRAVLDESSGKLPFGHPVTFANLHIDYLYLEQATGVLKPATLSCPARVRLNCLTNPYASNCVRAVRVRVCSSVGAGGTCTPVEYDPIFLANLGMPLPVSTTIVKAETLGYRPGDPLCAP
jgi:Flp pilus assembly protein TadG